MLSELSDGFIQLLLAESFNLLLEKFLQKLKPVTFVLLLCYRRSKYEDQLRAHPISNNNDLWGFRVRSHNIFWHGYLTPLAQRRRPRYLGRGFNSLDSYTIAGLDGPPHREVLVCHDMMGNYREDRHYAGSRKWDEYKFYHWSGVDYFCYFSHHYITIPPACWINAAHAHGVKVLGTFITERQPGTRLMNEVLESYYSAERTANALVTLCEHFCFEGWLINIECAIDGHKIPLLMYFLETLKRQMHSRIPNSILFWYDSLIQNGRLSWQNEINVSNMMFFNVCDAILINYKWTDESLMRTKQIVESIDPNRLKNVFFGIDIFGRGQMAKFDTDKTLARIVRNNFSVGFFAPGWTYESIKDLGYNLNIARGHEVVNGLFLQRNDKFWSLLWANLGTYAVHSVPFYTDFCLGAGKKLFIDGLESGSQFFNISKQSMQPSVPLFGFIERCFDSAVNGGSCLRLVKPNILFRLFTTDILVRQTLIFGYAFRSNSESCQVDCVLKAQEDSGDRKSCELVFGNYSSYAQEGRVYFSPIDEDQEPLLVEMLQEANEKLRLPFELYDDWEVNYFVVKFSRPVTIHDIGCTFRVRGINEVNQRVHLGALYLHCVNTNRDDFSILSVDNYFY